MVPHWAVDGGLIDLVWIVISLDSCFFPQMVIEILNLIHLRPASVVPVELCVVKVVVHTSLCITLYIIIIIYMIIIMYNFKQSAAVLHYENRSRLS